MVAFFERSCDNCRRLKIRCDRIKPCCKNCDKRQVSCTRNKPLQKRGPKPKKGDANNKARKRKLDMLSNSQDPSKDTTSNSESFHSTRYRLNPDFQSKNLNSPGMTDGMDLCKSHYDDDCLSEASEPLSDITTSTSSSDPDKITEPLTPSAYKVGTYAYNHNEVSNLPSTPDLTSQGPSKCENSSPNSLIHSPPYLVDASLPPAPKTELRRGGGGRSSYGSRYFSVNHATPSAIDTTIKDDLTKFETRLRSSNLMEKNHLTSQQADYIVYYFANVQSHLPVVSQQRFLTLLENSSQPEATLIQDHSIKTLIGSLCQVAYLFAANPHTFQHSILSFLVQAQACQDLDPLFTTPSVSPKFPLLLTATLGALIRFHCHSMINHNLA